MKFIVCHLLIGCAILALSRVSVAQPRDGEAPQLSPAQRRAKQKFHDRVGWHLVGGVWVRASGSCRWDELIHLGWRGSDFVVEVAPTTQATRMLKGGRRAAIEIAPMQELYEVSLHEISPIAPPPELQGVARPARMEEGEMNSAAMYVLARAMSDGANEQADGAKPQRDVSIPNSPLRIYSVMAAPGVLRINGHGTLRGSQMSIAFFAQADRSVRLTVYDSSLIGGDKPASQTLAAESVQQLVAEHPREVRRYLSPLLRPLGAGDVFAPAATDVYLAFAQIAPSVEMAGRVDQILPKLRDDQFAVRTAAMAELRGLGAAGVCAAARLDRSQLHPQEQALIEQLLRENSRRGVTDPAEASELRRDALFLVDCLEYPDPEVRLAAREALTEVLQKSVQVDVNDQAACTRLAASLREAAFRAAPATQPSGK